MWWCVGGVGVCEWGVGVNVCMCVYVGVRVSVFGCRCTCLWMEVCVYLGGMYVGASIWVKVFVCVYVHEHEGVLVCG